MSFLFAAALALTALVVAPLAAHLLRRGRAVVQPFPPAAWVPPLEPLARRRNRLEDRALLVVRALSVVGLALLGAVPLVRCSHLSVSRNAGASVALAVVLDDSLSMSALDGGVTRFERARTGALQLLGSLRQGDAVALVLAGHPARLSLGLTTDLEAARAAVSSVAESDRATDLRGALQLAEGALSRAPQPDRRVVVLSDLAGDLPAPGAARRWIPLPELARSFGDCAVVFAEAAGAQVLVTVACTPFSDPVARQLSLLDERGNRVAGPVPVVPRAGVQVVELGVEGGGPPAADARLEGRDAIPRNDQAPVSPGRSVLRVGVLADPTSAGVATGGATVVEQALAALPGAPAVQPLDVLDEDADAVAALGLLVLDDPRPLGPEARAAVTTFVERGGVLLCLLGPASLQATLGSSLEPLVPAPLALEEMQVRGVDAASAAWLGEEGRSLADLGAAARVRLTVPPGGTALLRWADGTPFLTEQPLGEGLVLVAGLPASVTASDFALRPGFLALLDHALELARLRAGARVVEVGTAWTFPGEGSVTVTGPTGAPAVLTDASDGRRTLVPDRAGRWLLRHRERTEVRVARIDPKELEEAPRAVEALQAGEVGLGPAPLLEISREVALALLALLAVELVLRAFAAGRRRQERRLRTGSTAPPAAAG